MHMEGSIEIRARRNDFRYNSCDAICLYASRIINGSVWRHEGELKFVELTPDEKFMPIQPFLTFEMSDAQKLMDDLWDCGLRPSEGAGSAGSLKKTENHLSDMRKIAFHKLGIVEA